MSVLSEPMKADPSQHRQELIERLDALRRDERFCDVTVAVNGKEFKTHKVVLAAASPFFLALLESDMKESNEQLISIELEEAASSVMDEVLKYIYTGNVSVSKEICHNLIATADYLLLPGLKTFAGNFMKENLTIENCIFNYYFADKYQCFELREGAHEEIITNFSAVMETGDFLNLDIKQVIDWVSSDDIIVGAEEEIFKGTIKWVSHNKTERERHVLDLLHQVRLRSISSEFLFHELIHEELITSSLDCVNFVLGHVECVFNSTSESCSKPARKCLQMLEDVIFVCGGRKALCYLPHTDEWYQLMGTTLEHQDHAAVQYRGKVYIFSKQGVRYESDQSQLAEYYMPSTDSWGAFQTKFQHEEEFTSLFVLDGDTALYALTNTEISPENTIYRYHPDKNTWEMCGDEALSRWGACGVTDGKCIYIMGGTKDETQEINGTTKVEKFSPNESIWEEVAAMNEARHSAFGAAMNGKIYIAGGLHKNGQICSVLKTCEVYNPSTDEWQLIPSLNAPRHSASMVSFKGALYVVGGLKHQIKSRELSVEILDFDANEWREKSTIPIKIKKLSVRVKKEMHYKACSATIYKDQLKKPLKVSFYYYYNNY